MMNNTVKVSTPAPYFDRLLQVAKAQPIVVKDCDKKILMSIYQAMTVIEADKENDDYRHLWFNLDRGKIKDFGSYREYKKAEEVSDREQFEELWTYYYPENKHWYHFQINEYNGNIYFYLDKDLAFHLPSEPQTVYDETDNSELLLLLNQIISECCEWIARDDASYNQFLNDNLAYSRRKGNILRSKYWKINPYNKTMICKGLNKNDIETLSKIVAQSKDDFHLQEIQKMTSGKFFHYCRLGYDANGYFKKHPDISDKDAYQAFSDGRDEGMKELDVDSIEEFKEWYFNRTRGGGHPWEVCRGGNSTHISLYIQHTDSHGWWLRLDGSSVGRVNETVKFAIALYNNNIPFKLHHAEEIYRMVTGTDYIGIVPKEIFPRYCHTLFPPEAHIIDFMNLGWEDTEEIVAAAEWYPVEIKKMK